MELYESALKRILKVNIYAGHEVEVLEVVTEIAETALNGEFDEDQS